jgi:energy-coupling factor transport system substrate-specific component
MRNGESGAVMLYVGVAGFSVVAGIVFAVTSHWVAPLAFASGGHLGIALIYGLWFMGGPLTAYIVRRPWSAFLGETIGSIVELLMVSPYSIMLYYYGPAQGIVSEAVFRAFRYRNFSYKAMMLAGGLPALAAYPFDCLVSPFYPACRSPGYPPELHAGLVSGMLVSGAILAGVLVKAIVDAAVSSGALRRWPVAQMKD